MSNKQMTAVEWYSQQHLKLLIKLENKELSIGEYAVQHQEILNQAKQLEKQQIIDAYLNGRYDADKIVMTGQNGRTQEVDIIATEISTEDGKFRISVTPDLNSYFIDNPDKIANFLIVKKIKDEQNVILQFKKPAGATSYGFVISEDIDPNLIDNISTIQTNVQNQLLSTQENTG
jgi:hypothetical protein